MIRHIPELYQAVLQALKLKDVKAHSMLLL